MYTDRLPASRVLAMPEVSPVAVAARCDLGEATLPLRFSMPTTSGFWSGELPLIESRALAA